MGLALIFIVLALFWVLLIVPRQREARRQRALLASLAEGDRVLTSGGIHGTVASVGDETVLLEVAPGSCLTVDRRAVLSRLPEPTATGLDRPEPTADVTDGTED